MLRRVLESKNESPDMKRRRKDAEESEISTRRLHAENRRLELELRQQEVKARQQEVKASQAVQEGTLTLITKLIDKFGGES